jgi:hypothetical protein
LDRKTLNPCGQEKLTIIDLFIMGHSRLVPTQLKTQERISAKLFRLSTVIHYAFMKELRLDKFIPIIIHTFKAIDLRSLLIRRDDEWICCLLVIRATIRNQQDVSQSHSQKLEFIPIRKTENLDIVLEAHDIQEINSIIDQLDSGFLELGGKRCRIDCVVENIRDREVKQVENYLVDPDKGYPSMGLLFSTINTTPLNFLESHGISASELDLEIFKISSLFSTWITLTCQQIHLLFFLFTARF